jgi:hypothetical protein
MHPLRLNYTNAPILWTRQGGIWLGIGLVLVASIGGYYGYLAGETTRATEGLESARQLTDRERMGHEKLSGELKTYRAEIKETQAVLDRLTIPWDPLFIAIEQLGARYSDRLTLMAIHPDMEKRQVVIDGRSADLDVLLDFVSHLTEFDIISHAYLSHHLREEKDQKKPVLFSIAAEWRIRS